MKKDFKRNISGLKRLTTEEARALQKKGVEKRKENQLKRKLIKEGLEERMGMHFDEYCDIIYKGALKGDMKAWELIRDTLGQKPVEKTDIRADTDFNVNIKVEK